MDSVNANVLRDGNFIAGSWSGAEGGRVFAVIDPATGRTVATVPDSGAAEANSWAFSETFTVPLLFSSERPWSSTGISSFSVVNSIGLG